MRFSYAESMTDPSFYLPLARAAEEAGFDSFVVPDSICYPQESDSTYPYTPDGNREFLEDKPFIEPFSLIPAMGAVTAAAALHDLRGEAADPPPRCWWPSRRPRSRSSPATASASASACRRGPRTTSPCGQPWERRGKRMDEQIEIIQRLMAGGFVEYHGEFYDLPAVKICPTPTEKLPILIGGHADAALRAGRPAVRRVDARRQRGRAAAGDDRPARGAARRVRPRGGAVRDPRHLDGRLQRRRLQAARGAWA